MSALEHQSRNEKMIDKLSQIVLDNLSNERFGVEELAKSYGMSRSQLHRKLKKLTKKSISRFIREIRLDEAHEMLQEDVGTVSEIAYKVGFSSPTYFNTCFRDYFGYPPGEAKYHKEKEPPAASIEPKAHSSNKKPFLIALATVLVLALFWLAFINYQNSTETNVDENILVEKSIAVLPFKNWSGDPELEYVSDGMTDAVITRLTKIKDIERVTPFSSVLRFKNSNKLISEIADELNVEYVLEGNFKLSGEAVQSNLNLIEVHTNKHLWSLEYNGFWKANQIFELQAEVAENVAEYMKAEVVDTEREFIHRKLTRSEEAYRLYLQAEYQYNKLGTAGLKNSIGLYEQSVSLDSTFVEPLIGLANVYTISGLVWGILSQQEAWEKTKEYLYKAREKDLHNENRSFIDLLFRHGKFYYELDVAWVEKGYLSSDTTKLVFGRNRSEYDFLRKTGRFKSAMKLVNERWDLDPAWVFGDMNLAFIHCQMGNKEEAIELLSKSDPLMKDNHFYLQESAKWYYYMEQHDKSRRNTELMLELSSDRRPIAHWLNAVNSHIDGQIETVDSSLAELNRLYENGSSGSPAWFLAMYYFHANELDKAFEWLQKSYESREVELTWLKEEPMLKSVRYDPRYIKLYNQLGFNAVEELPDTPIFSEKR